LQKVFGDENIETFPTEFAIAPLQSKMLALPAPEADTHKSKDTAASGDSEEEPLTKELDIGKLQERIHQKEEREADLQEALKVAETEIQEYRAEQEAVKAELYTVKSKVQYLGLMMKDVHKLKDTVDQHIEKTPLLIDQASKDLKIELQEEKTRRLLLQGQIMSSIKSEVKTLIQAQIPELQHNMKEELKKAVQQLRDEMEKKMYEMERKMSDKHEEREEVC